MTIITVAVWICDNCGNYYAAEGAGDLDQQWNTDNKGNRTFPRSRCPTLACAQQDIQRRRVHVNVRTYPPVPVG